MQDKLNISNNNMIYNHFSKNEQNDIDEDHHAGQSPFNLENESLYQIWREEKLSYVPVSLDKLLVKIDRLDSITAAEKAAILDRCRKYNMAIYQTKTLNCDPETLKVFTSNFGLENLDLHFCNDNNGITALKLTAKNNKGGFIPYSDQALNWHTDGYYNPPERKIFSILLHCDTPARQGGENWLMDHEMVYLRLRDKNPAYIKALMDDNVMTIPAFIEKGEEIRSAQSGPVFSTYNNGQNLHMRFSQRKRNIIWAEDQITSEAISYLNALLNDDKKDALKVKLKKGQGVLCNNILHNRSAFKDEPEQSRLLFRGRFFEPLN